MASNLLALHVLRAPEINSELLEAEQLFNDHYELFSEESLIIISSLSRKAYRATSGRAMTINLAALEQGFQQAKHAISTLVEDDFV